MKTQSLLGTILCLSSLGILAGACGSSTPPGFGESCDPTTTNACGMGLVCATAPGGEAFCAIAPGETCDPEDGLDNHGCQPDGVCAPLPAAPGVGTGGSDAAAKSVCLLGEGSTCDPDAPFCDEDLTCAEIVTGEPACFGRVVLRGTVSDTADSSAVTGAHVIALDEEGSAVTDVAVSEASGSYVLDLPVVREEDGTPVEAKFTLQSGAQNYQAFPLGARVALPISASDFNREERLYVIDNALTDVGLIPLPPGSRTKISGVLVGLGGDSKVAGALLAASGDSGTFTAISDLSGVFTIFNVPDDDFEVRAYGATLQVAPEQVSVDGAAIKDLRLQAIEDSTTTVRGNIQIVNAPGGAKTSVILVVEDTFDEGAARGEVPRGLRAPSSGPVSVDGDFEIQGVPEGRYVVLAAYENDDLVRDPDTNIAGTGFVHIDVMAGATEYMVSDSFKVTEALQTFSPGTDGPEAVSDKPVLVWADDSSEDYYDLRVFDAFGKEVWSSLAILGLSGSDKVEVQYEGPLEPGMYYQFRASSWRSSGKGDPAPISMTEDLRGVFFLPAP